MDERDGCVEALKERKAALNRREGINGPEQLTRMRFATTLTRFQEFLGDSGLDEEAAEMSPLIAQAIDRYLDSEGA